MLFLGIVIRLPIAGEIAEEVLVQERFAFELLLMMWVHTHIGTVFTPLAVALHYIGSTPVAVVLSMLFAAWHYLRRHRSWAVFILPGTALPTAAESWPSSFSTERAPNFGRALSRKPATDFPSGHSTLRRRAGHGGGAG